MRRIFQPILFPGTGVAAYPTTQMLDNDFPTTRGPPPMASCSRNRRPKFREIRLYNSVGVYMEMTLESENNDRDNGWALRVMGSAEITYSATTT